MSIEEKYFSILHDYFQQAFNVASRYGFVKEKYRPVLNRIYSIDLLVSTINSLTEDLSRLDWHGQEESIRNAEGITANFVGAEYGYQEPLGRSTSEFLKKTALYADTIVLEDRLLAEISQITYQLTKRGSLNPFAVSSYFSYATDFAFEFMQLEDLFLPDSGKPICRIAPSMSLSFNKNGLKKKILDISQNTTRFYASEIFKKTFATNEELEKHLKSISSDHDFFSQTGKLTHQDGALITEKELEEFRAYRVKENCPIDNVELYELILDEQNSVRIHDLVYNGILGSIPTTRHRKALDSILWLTKNDNSNITTALGKKVPIDTLIMTALNQENLKWLGNVPLDKIQLLREQGELEDLREIFSKNIGTLQKVTDSEFLEISKDVKYNIEQALLKHSSEVKNLNDKFRTRYGFETVSIVVSGTLGIISAVYPTIAEAIGILSVVLGGGSIYSGISDLIAKRQEIKELNKKPIAMLFDARKNYSNQ